MSESLSIVIVNFQSRDYLKRCLKSLFTVIGPESEVLVINNDSSEDLSLLKGEFPRIKILEDDNTSLGKAWNLGIERSQGEVVWILNPDTELVAGDMKKILDEFKKNSRLAVVGPQLITAQGESQSWSAGRDSSLWDVLLNNLGLVRSRKIWESPTAISADWVSGAAFFVSRRIWERLRGFDEEIERYFEDMDFCRRARKEGFLVMFFPEFKVKHYCGRSHKDKKAQKRVFYASQDYYFQKHLGRLQAFWLKVIRKIFLFS